MGSLSKDILPHVKVSFIVIVYIMANVSIQMSGSLNVTFSVRWIKGADNIKDQEKIGELSFTGNKGIEKKIIPLIVEK